MPPAQLRRRMTTTTLSSEAPAQSVGCQAITWLAQHHAQPLPWLRRAVCLAWFAAGQQAMRHSDGSCCAWIAAEAVHAAPVGARKA